MAIVELPFILFRVISATSSLRQVYSPYLLKRYMRFALPIIDGGEPPKRLLPSKAWKLVRME